MKIHKIRRKTYPKPLSTNTNRDVCPCLVGNLCIICQDGCGHGCSDIACNRCFGLEWDGLDKSVSHVEYVGFSQEEMERIYRSAGH